MPIFSYTTKEGKALWGARVNHKDDRRVAQGFSTPEEAWENHWRIKREMMLNSGNLKPQDITLDELAARWVEFKRSRVKASTLEEYTHQLEARILLAFGKRSLASIKPMELQTWLDKQPSPRIANKCRFVLGNMFKLAIKWRVVEYDPTYALDGYKEVRAEGRALTVDELQAMLRHLDMPRTVQVLLAVSTGMRIGEINALTWKDVQPEYIIVDKAFRMGRLEVPKTYRGKRLVTISPSISNLLGWWKAAQWGVEDEDLLFPGPRGGHQEAHVLWYHVQRASTKAGIGKVRVHDLRHTYTTWMVQGARDPKFLQDQLGHADIITTLQTYTHTTEETREEYRAWFEREIAPGLLGEGEGNVIPLDKYREK